MKDFFHDPHTVWYLAAASACAVAGVLESLRRSRRMRHREGLFTEKERRKRERKEKK